MVTRAAPTSAPQNAEGDDVKKWACAWGIVGFVLVAAVPGAAQPLAPPGDIAPSYAEALPPYEIIASVRSAGFRPLSRPVQRGPVYVLFAVDRYFMDVRVTVDARSGRVLSATRLAGALYGGPGYDGHDVLPRPQTLGYPPLAERPPRGYERAPVPPADVPGYGPGRPYGPPESVDVPSSADLAKRAAAPSPLHPPLPRARPGDIITGSVKEAVPPPPAAPPSTAPPAAPGDATVNAPPPPQQPTMVPIAPLE